MNEIGWVPSPKEVNNYRNDNHVCVSAPLLGAGHPWGQREMDFFDSIRPIGVTTRLMWLGERWVGMGEVFQYLEDLDYGIEEPHEYWDGKLIIPTNSNISYVGPVVTTSTMRLFLLNNNCRCVALYKKGDK